MAAVDLGNPVISARASLNTPRPSTPPISVCPARLLAFGLLFVIFSTPCPAIQPQIEQQITTEYKIEMMPFVIKNKQFTQTCPFSTCKPLAAPPRAHPTLPRPLTAKRILALNFKFAAAIIYQVLLTIPLEFNTMVNYTISQYFFVNYTPQTYAFPLSAQDYYGNSFYSCQASTNITISSMQGFQEVRSQDSSLISTSLKQTTPTPILRQLSKEKPPKQKPNLPKKSQNHSFTEKRNIIPNNINHILAFIQRKSKSWAIIERAIQQHKEPDQPYSTKQFYCYQQYLKGKIHVHVNKQTLELLTSHLDLHSAIFSIEQQLFYNRICRIAICYYLRNMAHLTTLNSRRLRETSRADHLKAQRFLVNFMRGCNQEK